ncbi:MAG: hypothetical protein K0S70_4397, partial [Microbacterium sp.]|nr:hypothetical protein [Microbacterium sp.]
VDTSGRSIGVRFTLPLWDDTEYTVEIADVASVSGGPAATIAETFRTPAAHMFLLQRAGAPDGGDLIYRTDLGGQNAVPVFSHGHIEDFRATASHLVVSVRTDDDSPGLIVTDLDGSNERELALPGDGFVSNLQSADRGELIGYTFSDAQLTAESGRMPPPPRSPWKAPTPAWPNGGSCPTPTASCSSRSTGRCCSPGRAATGRRHWERR